MTRTDETCVEVAIVSVVKFLHNIYIWDFKLL